MRKNLLRMACALALLFTLFLGAQDSRIALADGGIETPPAPTPNTSSTSETAQAVAVYVMIEGVLTLVWQTL